MPHPSYSYLTPETLEMALDLARSLRHGSQEVTTLAYGGGVGYEGGGRTGDKYTAARDWVGPHKDTFELLFNNERDSIAQTLSQMNDEADAWAEFWATAINARNARLHEEAVNRHNAAMGAYRQQAADAWEAANEDPDNPQVVYLPSPPIAPTPKPLVTTPTWGMNYQPTG